ncbi:hypothetical protein NP493_1667g00012 [Ridgeia piscesae]|uniref:Galactosylgalactosylxylosylprotein 3-beta-glucuronosyltransferase n=1 Tax=Ridgeia piscesae TaxID=27915 RepID=A0AAD9JVR7_RIDPI|nr:hypothetical protein NP493_1667g00012 [Ridgeia piscesae]
MFVQRSKLLFLYISVICLGIFVTILTYASIAGDKPDCQSVFPHDVPLQDLDSRQQELDRKLSQLRDLEVTLRRSYPQKVAAIEQIVDDRHVPTIYVITPTYARTVQKAELTRLSYTFLHVPKLHWILVEDSPTKTALVSQFLSRCGLTYTHLNVATPPVFKTKSADPHWLKPRGVLQRNLGLEWLREHLHADTANGVVYFADDDNTYDIQLFEEMRYTKRVSVWPVGLSGYLRYESPVVTNGHVTSWFTYFRPDRAFATDMAGFSINVRLLLDRPEAVFKNTVRRGHLETNLLSAITTMGELEPKAHNCTKVLVWHTRTEKADLRNEDKFKKRGFPGSNPDIEV